MKRAQASASLKGSRLKDEVWSLFGVSFGAGGRGAVQGLLEPALGLWHRTAWGGLLCNTFIIANYLREEEEEAPGKGAGSELWEVAGVVVAAAEDAGANE